MKDGFVFSQFLQKYPDDLSCLEEIRKLRYPRGIYCSECGKVTKHYKLQGRMAYSCRFCRGQVYPLAGTILEKSTTPLRLWFFAMFLLIHTRGELSIQALRNELGVTYKTAWRMYQLIWELLMKNNGDLLSDNAEEKDRKLFRWTFFNKLELTVTEKEKHLEER
jgi:hypothetical protein